MILKNLEGEIMKSKLFVRVICVILAVVMLASAFLCAIQIFSASAAITPSANASGYISGDYVNLRSGAGTNYSIITCMRENTKITFVDGELYNSSWYKVKLNSDSRTGYVMKTYVEATSSPSDDSDSSASSDATGYISADYVNLRSGAGTNYSIVTCMRQNTKFTILSTKLYNSDWYSIRLSNGQKGYVKNTFVKITSNGGSKSDDSSNSDSNATGYINADYVNLRSGAGTNYSIVTCMREKTKFTFTDTKLYNSRWYAIRLSDGKKGYVVKEYVTKDSTSKPSDDKNSTETKPSSDNTGSSIKLSNTSETIYVGNKLAITARCSDSVKWSSSDNSVASVDSNGIVSAKSSGSATITASSGKYSASCKLNVKRGSNVNISSTNISNLSLLKSVYLTSSTSGVSWKSSNTSIATVKNGIVDTKATGFVTITAYTSSGAATCLIKVISRDSVQFVYATPNSAPKNSTVSFKAITDTDRTAVRFVVSNGSTSYTVNADKKEKDGDNFIWSGSQKLSKPGKWKFKAYAMFRNSGKWTLTSGNGEGEAFVTNSTDTETTVTGERRASDQVIGNIANYEGFLSKVTPDSITSDPTLGYGKVVLSNEQFYNNITKSEAYAYLYQTVNKGGYTSKTNDFLINNDVKFNQQQFDALVCFAYNVGSYAIYNDSDLKDVLLNTKSGGSSVSSGASGYVNDSYVNLRSGAGTGYSVLTCMAQNTKFTFADGKTYNSNWYKIKLSNGTVGYIYKTYASVSGGSGSRDLNNVNKQSFIDNFFAYHHAAGSCYWGLLYRRIDEAEMFFYGDYARDGSSNKYDFKYTCHRNGSVSVH